MEKQLNTIDENKPMKEREKRYGEHLLQQARQLIHDFLPEEEPQEPTRLLLLRKFPDFHAIYLGKINNAGHHIGFALGHKVPKKKHEKDLAAWLQEKRDEYVMVHELFHQRHCEIVGQEMFMGEPEEKVEGLEYMSQGELAAYILSEDDSDADRNLFDYVTEGVAYLGELFIMKKDEQRLRSQGRLLEAEAVRIVREKELRTIRHEVRQTVHGVSYANIHFAEYSLGVARLMKGLEKRFTMEELPHIIKMIDLDACAEISEDSNRFLQILEDPTLLPGLEGFYRR